MESEGAQATCLTALHSESPGDEAAAMKGTPSDAISWLTRAFPEPRWGANFCSACKRACMLLWRVTRTQLTDVRCFLPVDMKQLLHLVYTPLHMSVLVPRSRQHQQNNPGFPTREGSPLGKEGITRPCIYSQPVWVTKSKSLPLLGVSVFCL